MNGLSVIDSVSKFEDKIQSDDLTRTNLKRLKQFLQCTGNVQISRGLTTSFQYFVVLKRVLHSDRAAYLGLAIPDNCEQFKPISSTEAGDF